MTKKSPKKRFFKKETVSFEFDKPGGIEEFKAYAETLQLDYQLAELDRYARDLLKHEGIQTEDPVALIQRRDSKFTDPAVDDYLMDKLDSASSILFYLMLLREYMAKEDCKNAVWSCLRMMESLERSRFLRYEPELVSGRLSRIKSKQASKISAGQRNRSANKRHAEVAEIGRVLLKAGVSRRNLVSTVKGRGVEYSKKTIREILKTVE